MGRGKWFGGKSKFLGYFTCHLDAYTFYLFVSGLGMMAKLPTVIQNIVVRNGFL